MKEWFFDGLGTEIIVIIIGLIITGGAGAGIAYKVCSKNKQNQKAGDNANQTQIGSINNIDGKD